MKHQVSAERYEQTIADYARLLSRDYDPDQEKWRVEHDPGDLSLEESQLGEEQQAILGEFGFLPTIRIRSTTKDGTKSTGECWVDASGATRIEFGLSPSSVEGLHFISTYFADGTAISLWPADSIIAKTSSETRTNIRGVSDLRKDIETALAARDEKMEAGVRALLTVDVETARLHGELHARFFHENPYKLSMENIDTSEFWKIEVRIALYFLALIVVVTLIGWAIFGHNTTFYTAMGAAAAMVLFTIGKSWWTRDQPRDPFAAMSPEQVEELARKIEEEAAKTKAAD